MPPRHIKVYFGCDIYYGRSWAVRPVESGIAPWRTAVKESMRGPTKAERAFGLYTDFEPRTRAKVTKAGHRITVDMDSRTFFSGAWREVTGGVAAVRALEYTLKAIDAQWTVEFRIDGVRDCEFAEGAICDK